MYEDTAGVEDSIWVIKYEITEERERDATDWLEYREKLRYHTENLEKEFHYGTNPDFSSIKEQELIYLLRETYGVNNSTHSITRF